MSEWISVKDALPDLSFVIKVCVEDPGCRVSNRCLMWDDEIWDGWMKIGECYKKHDKPPVWEGDDQKPFNCTHWMYAPEPPKED